MGRRSQADARQARKMERATRHTFSSEEAGAQGQSIVEMMEERLYDVAKKWAEWAPEDTVGRGIHRGEMRGLAISIALIRHPLRRYETAWWGYVKKLEKRAVSKARNSE